MWAPLELLNRYNFCREVVGACDANDTMSRWSDQLLLTAENDHIEGSMLLKAKGGIVSRFVRGGLPKKSGSEIFSESKNFRKSIFPK